MWKMNGTFLSHLLSSFSVFWFCQANHPHKKSVQKHKAWMDGLSIVVKKKTFLRLSSGLAWYDMEHEFASSLLAYFPEYLN